MTQPPAAASVAYPVGVSVRPVTLSKTFRDARQRDAAAIKALRAKASLAPSPSVTDPAGTYGAVTGGNGRSPLPCPTCSLPTWDGLHATGHRACYMGEVPGV